MNGITNLLLANSVFGTVLSIVIAILILLLTITVHELGHYIVGKILKFKINEFAIGMGPAIFKKKKKNGEIFSIRIFPLGGFCAFEGEDGDPDATDEKQEKEEKVFDELKESAENKPEEAEGKHVLSENAFSRKKPWQRILVLLAGATMNFIFAIILITVKFVGYGHFELMPTEVIPNDIVAGDTLQANDVILKIDDKFIYLTTDFVDILNGKKKGDIVKLQVLRDGEKTDVTVVLHSDVSCVSMSDTDPCFKALGVGSVPAVKANGGSAIADGAYLLRFAEYTDKEDFSKCTRIYSLEDLYEKLKDLSAGESVNIWTFKVGDEDRKVTELTAPENYESVDKRSIAAVLGAFGLESEPTAVSYQIYSTSVKLGFFEALFKAPAYGFKTLWTTLRSFGELLSGKIAITEVSGPVGTVSITSQFVSSWRLDYILEIAALIGVSIAVFNVLPIPALDGARVVFVIIEWIRKKPVPAKIEGTIHFVGLIALITFAILVDVLKLFI